MPEKQFDVSTDGELIHLRIDGTMHTLRSITAIALKSELYKAVRDIKQNKILTKI